MSEELKGNEMLVPYVKASFPILYLLTPEETRAEVDVLLTAKQCNRSLYVWSCTDGLKHITASKETAMKELDAPVKALEYIQKDLDESIFVFRDLHRFFDQPKVLRLLRDIACKFRQGSKTLILVGPVGKLPPELERDITLIEYQLPGRDQLQTCLNLLTKGNKTLSSISTEEKDKVVEASLGLTINEAENAMAKAFIESQGWKDSAKIVMREKAMMVKKTGILEYFAAKETSSDVGGLLNFKKWLTERKEAYSKEAREFGLPLPRGCVLAGLPGCGKSLCAKAASNLMGVPLIRFDISRVFAGLVGQSEQQMRFALQTIDAIGPAVVWCDELEKALAGVGQSQSGDSGVSQRVFGNFLTWLQERKGGAFVIATINRIDGLPPELLRKGRVDEIFFVDLPDENEREEILRIHITKRGRDAEKLSKDSFWKDCIKHSKSFSGAELEEAVITGLYKAFHHDRKKDLQMVYVDSAILNTTPLAKSQAQNLSGMLEWAKAHAVPANKHKEETDAVKLQRSLDL